MTVEGDKFHIKVMSVHRHPRSMSMNDPGGRDSSLIECHDACLFAFADGMAWTVIGLRTMA